MSRGRKRDAYTIDNVEKLIQIAKVEGNVTISPSVMLNAVKHIKKSQRKQWRGLAHVLYPLPNGDNERMRVIFTRELLFCLAKTFAGSGYVNFNGILRVASATTPDGENYSAYEFFCHQIEFSEMLRRRYENQLASIFDIKDRGVDSFGRTEKELREIMVEEIDAFEREWKEWTLEYRLAFTSKLLPIEFTYDPAAKRITLQWIRDLSTDPANYPDRVTTTSEMLRYIAALSNVDAAIVGDIFVWGKENYPLLKLVVDVMDDRRVQLDHLRINAVDYEEWDYVNTKLDAQIRESEVRKSRDNP